MVASDRREGDDTYYLRLPVNLVMFALAMAFIVVHVLVLMPIAYLPLAVASCPLTSIVRSPQREMVEIENAWTGARQELDVGKVVRSNEASLRSFLVGLPALTASILLPA